MVAEPGVDQVAETAEYDERREQPEEDFGQVHGPGLKSAGESGRYRDVRQTDREVGEPLGGDGRG